MSSTDQITVPEYRDFTKSFEAGSFKGQRFGQAFLNHFSTACPHNAGAGDHPCIFNEQNRGKVQQWIEANGVDWSSV